MDDSVTKMDFHNSTLTENTLHLPGGKLRYSRKYTKKYDRSIDFPRRISHHLLCSILPDIGVAKDEELDLVVSVYEGDYTDIADVWASRNKGIKNGYGPNNAFGNINLQTVKGKPKSGEGNFEMCFVKKGTDIPVTVEQFTWTFYDLDERGNDNGSNNVIKEKFIMDLQQVELYQLVEGTEIVLSCEDGSDIPCAPGVRTVFQSSTKGRGQDNPSDPNNLTVQQMKRSVSMTLTNTSCWRFTYDHYCPADQPGYTGSATQCKGYTGGNFLFAGESEELIEEGDCLTASPTTEASPEPSAIPTSAPTETLCNYTLFDFEEYGDGTSTGVGYIHSNSWSEYGIVVSAHATGAFTPGNLTRFMDTATVVDNTFGSPNKDCSGVTGPGEGAGGVNTNCDGLGKVMIIQAENVAEPIAFDGGGDIVFDFDDAASTVMQLSLFNVRSGGKVTFELANGSKEEIEIAALEENEVLKLKNLNMQEVMKTVVHFEGVGAIADIGICRDPRKAPTPAPNGFAPPVETNEPTAAPTISTDSPSEQCPYTEPMGDGECPDTERVVYFGHEDRPLPPDDLIEVISFDESEGAATVTFKLSNKFEESVDYFFVQYDEQVRGRVGNTVCFQHSGDSDCRGEVSTFTALCHRGHDHPHAIVYVWTVAQGGIGGYDSLFDPIPDCCAASPDIEALPVVEYTFQVACGCPSTGRFLRG